LSTGFTHKATGDEQIDEINIGDDMADMEIPGDGDDEDELLDYGEVLEDVSESTLRAYED
jgi:hypothetical protein